MKKVISDTFFVTIALLSAIAIPAFLASLVSVEKGTNLIPFSAKMMIGGIIVDTFRAWVTSWTFYHFSMDKSSLTNTMFFGLMMSFLGGSLWVFGAFFNPDLDIYTFVPKEMFLLFLQGLAGGITLWILNRNQHITKDKMN